MTSPAEKAFRLYAGRLLLSGEAASDLVTEIPSPIIGKLSPTLRRAFDYFTADYLKHKSINSDRVLNELANGDAREIGLLFSELMQMESIPPMEAIEKRIREGIARFSADGAGLEPISGTRLTTMEIAAPPMIMDPLLPAGGKGIFAGGPGIGKTLLAEGIALDVGNALPVVDRFPTTKGPVIYFDAENPAQLVKKRVAKIAAGKGARYNNLFFVFPKRKLELAKRRHREDVINLAKRESASLLIFDSFLCFASLRNENDNTETRSFLELASEIPRESGAAILFIDHAPKPSADRLKTGAPLLPRGAGAKMDWADCVLTFAERKHESKFLRVLSFPKTRWCAQPGNLLLEMDTNLCFKAIEEDQICSVWHVRTALAGEQGIPTGKLVEKVIATTGASKRSALYAIGRAKADGYVTERKKGRETLNFLKEEQVQGSFAPIEHYEAQELEI